MLILSSSPHIYNPKKNLLLSKGPTEGINGSVGAADKKFSINFKKANTKFFLKITMLIRVTIM